MSREPLAQWPKCQDTATTPGLKPSSTLTAPSTWRISPFPRSNDPSGLVAEPSLTRSPLRRPNFFCVYTVQQDCILGLAVRSTIVHGRRCDSAAEDLFEGDQAERVVPILVNRLAVREPGPFQSRQTVEMVGLTWNCGPWLHVRRILEKDPSRGEPACRLCTFCPSLRNGLHG